MRFGKIKNDILGPGYDLSIAFVSSKKSQELNKKYRKKDKPTNVLSFSLYKNQGELVLCNAVIKKEIKNQPKNLKRNYKSWLTFLVIHGMLHLKGMTHSSKMDEAEKHFSKKYDKKYFDWNRRGNSDDESRRGRIRKRRKAS